MKPKSIFIRRELPSRISLNLPALSLATLLAVGLTHSADAAPATWNVNTSGDWNVAGNWNPSVPGVTGNATTADTAGFGGTSNYSVYLSGTRSIAAQTFSNTGTTTLLGGTTATAANEFLYLYNGITINAGSGAVTIGDTAGSPTRKVDIRAGTYTIANNSTSLLTIANALQSRGGAGSTTTITLGGSGPITVSGPVGGGLGAAVALSKTGAAKLTLSGTNNNSGGVTLSGATANSQLNINSTTALGSGAFTINGGDNAKIDNTSGAAITLANNNAQTWSNNFAFVGSNDLNMGTGAITLGGNRQVTVTAKVLTLGGIIGDGTNTYSLTKAGAGTLVLSNANTYDGATSVTAGILRPTHANALGSTTGGTTASTGSVELTAGITPNPAETFTIAGSGANYFGSLRAGAGGGTWAGTVIVGLVGTDARLGATAGNTLTVTGPIVNGVGTSPAISGESGTGVVVINPATANTYTGSTQIIRGILRLGKTDALPTGTILDVDAASSVADAAVFDMASFNQTAAALQDTATISISSKVTNSVASTNSVLTLNQTSNTFFEGVIENGAGTVSLVKNGGGTLTLAGANTYTGATSLNAGQLDITGAFAAPVTAASGTTLTFGGTSSASALSIASGAILRGEGALTGTGSLTFGSGTSILRFNANTPGSLAVPSVATTGATVLISPEGTVSSGNTYTVLANSAGFTGSPSPTYLPASRGTLAFGGAGDTELQFTAGTPLSLTWKGNDPSNPTFWDINSTANWDDGSGADVFFELDSVAFDDSATNTSVAVQNTAITVGGLNFNNSTKAYILSGGRIGGTASLTKAGSNSLTISNANSYTGGTFLDAGTLNINNAAALGAASGFLIIADATTIDNTSGAPVTTGNHPLVIDGNLTFTGSNDLNLGNGASNLGPSSVSSIRTITATASNLTLGGVIADGSGGANAIVKNGAGTLSLGGLSTYTGATTISTGTLKLGASGTSATSCPLGTTDAGTTVASGATLDFGGFKAYAEAITITGTGVGGNGALINSGADQINAVESLTLAGNASIGGNGNRFDVRTNSVPATLNLANFTLTKSGSNTVSLVGTAVSPGTGHIDITGGTFSIQTTTAMNGSAANTITVRNGATLGCYETGSWTAPVWSVIMDAGSSFTNSNGTAVWDGTVTLNGAANAGGTANLTLNGVIDGASGALTKTGAGTLTLAGTAANTYGGLTTVSAGFLYLNKPASVNAIPGDATIDSGGLTLQADDQISDTATVTLTTATSKFNLNAKSETVANVDVQNAGPTVAEGLLTGGSPGGKLTVTGTLTHTAGNITLNSSGAGNSSFINANTVINNGGDWTFGALTGTQKLIVGSGGLTIGGGSTIAVNALVGTADNYISLNGNVTSTAAATSNVISGLGQVQLNGTRTITVADGAAASDLTVSTIISDGTGTGAIIKEGAGTLTFDAVNTYTGTTTVNAGTLGGTGTVGAVTVAAAGTIAPGASTGTLTAASADLTAGGTLAIEVNDASTPKTDTLAVAGILNITGAKLNLSVSGAPTQTSYTIATAGSITGTFAPANVTGLPSGYALAYTTTQINLVKSGFEAWIAGKFPGETNPSIIGKTADPDGDGMNNITEFALDGAPNSGAATGKVVGKIASVGGSPTLVISLPVRAGVVNFTGATERVSDTVDGVTYKIQGSDGLATWDLIVSEVTGPDKSAIEGGLPALSSGDWTYRTFRSPGPVTGDPAEFLRTAVIAEP